MLDQIAAQGTGATGNTTDPAAAFGTTEGWIDMWISDDGQYLYQLFGLTGEIGVYGINGTTLTFIEKISGDLPMNNTQGIVSVGQPAAAPPVVICDVDGGILVGGPFEFCVSDGEADNIPAGAITREGSFGSNSQYVVTDDEGNILGLPPTPSAVNFDVAGPGICLVWHLSYEAGLTGLAVGNNVSQLEGCYDLSNEVRVIRDESGAICDGAGAVCETPTDIVVDVLSPRNIRVDWADVDNAERFLIQIRFLGETRIVGRGLIRNSLVHVFAPAGRDYEVRIQTLCNDGSQSEFSDWVPFSTPANDVLAPALSRSGDSFVADITIADNAEAVTSFTTYPNPVSDILNVNYRTTSGTAVLSVFHISGQQVIEQALGQDVSTHQLNVANLANGIYLVRIDENNQAPIIQRVIKGSSN